MTNPLPKPEQGHTYKWGELIPVNETNIHAVAYVPDKKLLTVVFRDGAQYRYDRVPLTEFAGLIQAPSKGKYFQTRIRNVYQWEKLN